MKKHNTEISWAPRVPRRKILRLYEAHAKGVVDDDLIDEIAHAFYARCKSIIRATEAARGRAECPVCGTSIPHHGKKDELLICSRCSWKATWGDYFRSYHGKQLIGGGGYEVFKDFVDALPGCKTSRDKMLLIDRILHECHRWISSNGSEQLYTRPIAVNLIEGKIRGIIVFLENLPECPDPAVKENLVAWRRKVLSG